MENRTYYYARVSTKEQNLDRQIAAFVALGAEEREIITDKESGKNLDRPGYQALKKVILRQGDTLIVKSLDRLSRSKTDIRNELQYFKDQGIRLKVIDLPTTMMDLPEGQSSRPFGVFIKVRFSIYSQCFPGVVRFSLPRLGFSAKSVHKGALLRFSPVFSRGSLCACLLHFLLVFFVTTKWFHANIRVHVRRCKAGK